MVISTGYNGSPRGYQHCDDDHDLRDGHCTRAVHAEANAVAQAARAGHRTEGAIAYVTHAPCWRCASLLRNAGVVAVVFEHAYRVDERVYRLGMDIRQWEQDT
jgi:dCMP deaminase